MAAPSGTPSCSRSSAPVPDWPYVPNGGGAACGLLPLEHVQWARGLPPPEQFRTAKLDEDLAHSLDLACMLDTSDLDRLRAEAVLRVFKVSQELKEEQVAWAADAPVALQPLVGKLHGPLFRWLALAIDFPDKQLLLVLQSLPLSPHSTL